MYIEINTAIYVLSIMEFKYILIVVLFVFTIVLENSSVDGKTTKRHTESSESESDSESDEITAAVGECSKTYDLEVVKKLKIEEGHNPYCNWTILGSTKCLPELRCSKVQLKGDGKECLEHYLEIEDGWGGNHRVCGETKLDKRGVRASYGTRDLFITVKGHIGGKVKCEIFCSKPNSLPDFIGKTRKRKVDNRCVCGIQNLNDRIVNGEDAKKFEFPWQAAIVNKGTRAPTCGGSLLNDRFILTASHCFWFSNTTADQVEVLLHAHLLEFTLGASWNADVELGQNGSIRGAGWNNANVTDMEERSIRLEVAEVILHPLFTEKYDYDVALLRLAHPVDLTSIEATPICLTKAGDTRDFVGEIAKVVGWGMPDEIAGSTTRLLQKLDVPVIKTDLCSKMMEIELTDRMLCAGYEEGGRDACMGDSGGPLTIKGPKNQFTQIGVVSWGEGCARKGRPGVYSRLTDLGDWVQYHTRKANSIWCRDSIEDPSAATPAAGN